MPYGGWNGAAEGLKTGMALGNQFNETRMKRDVLLQEQVKEKVSTYGKMLETQMGNLKTLISEMPDRSDPNAQKIIDTSKDQLVQTAKIIGTLNPQLGQQYEQMINTVHANTKDKATQATEAALAQRQAGDAQINTLMDAKFGPKGADAPTAGAAPAPMPETAPPGPAMAAPNQQIAMEPQAGLTSQAAAEPAMPMPEPMPSVAPQATPVAGPQMAQAPQVDERAAYETMLRKRQAEAALPPTAMESKLNDAQVKQIMELEDAAGKGLAVRSALQQAMTLLDEGIYTGPTAKLALTGASFTGVNPEKVKRTQAFQSLMGRQLGQQLKLFGSATAVSNLDLQTVEQYIGKDITQTEPAIREILQKGIDEVDTAVKNFNKKAPKFGMDPMELPKSQKDTQMGQSGNFTPDADGWVSLPGGARMRLKPGQ